MQGGDARMGRTVEPTRQWGLPRISRSQAQDCEIAQNQLQTTVALESCCENAHSTLERRTYLTAAISKPLVLGAGSVDSEDQRRAEGDSETQPVTAGALAVLEEIR
jgi:hypothetical protein